MPYIFGKLWHLAIIWAIRKAFQCILQGVRILLAKYTRISPTSDNDSYIEIFSQEDLALKSKLRPGGFLQHLPIFAGNSRSTGISQLRAGKTRSKRPRSHWLSTMHLLPYMWASFYPLDPSRYLFSFSSWRPKTKKFPFFTNFHVAFVKKTVGLLQTQFWCHQPST